MARNVAATVTMLLGMTAVVQAQDAVLAELYGNGVHAYHAGDYKDAHTSLNQAVKQGSKDPRCYFFRGLCYAKLGRPDEAKADFKKGAELETTKAGKLYNVSRALARVQGKPRLQVEGYRSKARFNARKVRVSKNKARYGDLSKNEVNAIQSNTPPGKVVIPKNTKEDKTNPFGGGTPAKGANSGASASDPPKKTTKPPATTTKSPFDKTPPAKTTNPPKVTNKPPATTNKPPATTNKPPATTNKPPAKAITKPAVTAPPVASGKKGGGVTKALFSLFRGGGKAVADQAIGGDVNKLLKGAGAKSKPPSTGKKFKGSNEAPNPFGDTKKKK